jgi:hypothetical protein
MKHSIQEIYCDEAGFTSNNLLDKNQPFFAYATVAINDTEARECVNQVIKDYRVQGGELKGHKLLKYNRGRQAIAHILSRFEDRIKVSIYHKKFNLACKFFEYIFEPAIAKNSSLFYRVNFHNFISNLLYCAFKARGEYAEEIFLEFQILMRNLDDRELNYLFSSLTLPNISPILDCIKTFCIHHRDTINQEINSLKGTNIEKWTLELTTTAIFHLLVDWGQEFHELKVFCDASQPLQDTSQAFDTMIGRENKIYIDIFKGKEEPLSFNLVQKIQFVESHQFPGIQIADIAASACAYAFREGRNENTASWIDYIPKILGGKSVIPEFEHLNLSTLEARRNYMLLLELVERSINKQPLLDGIGDFLIYATNYLLVNPNALLPPEYIQ